MLKPTNQPERYDQFSREGHPAAIHERLVLVVTHALPGVSVRLLRPHHKLANCTHNSDRLVPVVDA